MAMRHGGGGGGFAGAHQLATIPSTYQQPRANAQPGLPQPRHIGGGKGASSSTKRGVAGEYGMAVKGRCAGVATDGSRVDAHYPHYGGDW